MSRITATRYHDISCGHRVVGHEGKCAHLHGHNYRVWFTVEGVQGVDALGRVLDFSVIKSLLCDWLERKWDHKMIMWSQDPMAEVIEDACVGHGIEGVGIVLVPFNPTAEAMAQYLVDVVGPHQLEGTGTRLVRVQIDETRKCSATYELEE